MEIDEPETEEEEQISDAQDVPPDFDLDKRATESKNTAIFGLEGVSISKEGKLGTVANTIQNRSTGPLIS